MGEQFLSRQLHPRLGVPLACLLWALQIHRVYSPGYPNVLICLECLLDGATQLESRVSITANLTFFGIFTNQYLSLFLPVFSPLPIFKLCHRIASEMRICIACSAFQCHLCELRAFSKQEKCFSSSNQACIFPGPYFECTVPKLTFLHSSTG